MTTRENMVLPMLLFFACLSICACQATDSETLPTPTSPGSLACVSVTPSISEPIPDYLMTLRPAPGACYTLSEFGDLAPSLGWGANTSGLCVSVNPVLLLEPGDFPTAEEWLSRMYVIINGNVITEYNSLLETDALGVGYSDPETGEYLYKAPDGFPFRVCYEAELGIGTHTASVVINKASGELISYSWTFSIVE